MRSGWYDLGIKVEGQHSAYSCRTLDCSNCGSRALRRSLHFVALQCHKVRSAARVRRAENAALEQQLLLNICSSPFTPHGNVLSSDFERLS